MAYIFKYILNCEIQGQKEERESILDAARYGPVIHSVLQFGREINRSNSFSLIMGGDGISSFYYLSKVLFLFHTKQYRI